jgi:hypothetical protein
MSPERPASPDPLFQHLVLIFSTAALQNLGKLQNPATGKIEVDLEGAQGAIDMLAMLEARTRGNLADSENRTLQDALCSLRLNYVEVARTQPAPAAEEKAPPSEASESKAGDEDPHRFHKSYG